MNVIKTIMLTLVCFSFNYLPLSGHPTAFDESVGNDKILFASYIVIDYNIQYCLNLGESIRKFAGSLKDSPIHVYYTAQMAELVEKNFEKFSNLSIKLIKVTLPQVSGKYYFGFKPAIAAQAELDAESEKAILAYLDPDVIFINEPREFILSSEEYAAYRPVMHKNIGSLYSEKPDTFWTTIYKKMAVPESALFPMESIADKNIIRPYFNAGLVILRPERGVMRKWSEYYESLADDPDIIELCKDQQYNNFLHQAILTGVLLNTVNRKEMKLLPFAYNYPLFFEKFYESERIFDSIEDIVTLKVDFSFRQLPEDWDKKLKGPDGKISWLKSHYDRRGSDENNN
jgi:hypothetical protein